MSSLKSEVKKIMGYFGFNIIKVPRSTGNILKDRLSKYQNKGFFYEKEAFEAIKIISSNTMLTYETLVTLFEQVVYCEKNKIEGDFVECGTWKGGAIGLMALANLQFGKERRRLHLFDAFEEICQPDEEHDDEKLIAEVKKLTKIKNFGNKLIPLKGIYDQFGGPGTLQENKNLLEKNINYPNQFLNYHVGWFQETVPQDANQINEIAILRLDGDWYESTKICLDYLFDKVVDNGLVIIDDYGYSTGCKKAVDNFLESRKLYPILIYVSSTCRYFINQKIRNNEIS